MTTYNVYRRNADGTATRVGRTTQKNPYAAESAIARLFGYERETLFAKWGI